MTKPTEMEEFGLATVKGEGDAISYDIGAEPFTGPAMPDNSYWIEMNCDPDEDISHLSRVAGKAIKVIDSYKLSKDDKYLLIKHLAMKYVGEPTPW
mgnify:CR=1 FL=1